MPLNRLIIFGNILFLIAALCYFTVSENLAYAIGATALVLEAGGVVQLVRDRQRKSNT